MIFENGLDAAQPLWGPAYCPPEVSASYDMGLEQRWVANAGGSGVKRLLATEHHGCMWDSVPSCLLSLNNSVLCRGSDFITSMTGLWMWDFLFTTSCRQLDDGFYL